MTTGSSKGQHALSLKRGALLSPWVAPLTIAVFIVIAMLFEGSPLRAGDVASIFGLSIVLGVPFTYLVTLVFVLPVALLLRRKNALSAARLSAWCALLGPLAMFVYAWTLGERSGLETNPLSGLATFDIGIYIAVALLCGLGSGIAFCRFSGVRFLAR